MAGLFLFVFTIIIVIVIVRIGAIAFELTGMSWEQSKFQALSCFTLTGFTTKEAELITTHPHRKKIASMMMILGYAGSISLFATFVNFLSVMFNTSEQNNVIPFTNFQISSVYYQVGKLILLIFLLFIIYQFFKKSYIWEKVSQRIRRKMQDSSLVKSATFEDLTLGDTSYGIIRIPVREMDSFSGKTILKSKFKDETGANILSIERGSRMIPNPSANEKILAGDILYCFGKRTDFKKKILKCRN